MDSIEAADYHDLAFVSDPQVAPGGERVAEPAAPVQNRRSLPG